MLVDLIFIHFSTSFRRPRQKINSVFSPERSPSHFPVQRIKYLGKKEFRFGPEIRRQLGGRGPALWPKGRGFDPCRYPNVLIIMLGV